MTIQPCIQRGRVLVAALGLLLPRLAAVAQEAPPIALATLGEPNPVTPEISTRELEQILQQHLIPVLDVRSAQEYAIAHIPGSLNYYEKEIEQITKAYPDREAALVFYCNGPYCGSPGDCPRSW